MSKKEYTLIGVMSGTSLDGLDLAKVTFSNNNGKWTFELNDSRSVSFEKPLLQKLQNAMNLSGYELISLDRLLGKFIGEEILHFDLRDTQAIASHGHTIFHEPHKGITHQIGSLNEIYAKTKLPVIGDFRTLDVALKGEGAPLVPVGDIHLFPQYDATLNFGGIANITYLGKKIEAFDVCPLNQVLNYLCNKHFNCEYDKSGHLGKNGKVNGDLLEYFNQYDFYDKKGPKSLGKEDVDSYFISEINHSSLSPTDILATYYEHISQKIVEVLITKNVNKVICSGGGVYNDFLIESIIEKLKNTNVKLIIPDPEIIEFKEAIIFAFLGLFRGLEINNIYKEVTGAKENNLGGALIGKNPFIEK